jgi:hypothetical protein
MTADSLIEEAVSGTHFVRGVSLSFTAGVSYTYSVFIKKNTRTKLRIAIFDGLTDFASTDFDLIDLTFNNISGTSTIELLDNDWVRCGVTGVSTNTTSAGISFIYLRNSLGDLNYLGDGTSGFYVWGAQLEQGNLTSYIPTNGTAVTRNADVFQSLNVENFVGANEGTIYFQLKNAIAHSSTNKIMGLDDGTGGTSNFFGLYVLSASTGQVAIRNRQANADLTNTAIPNPENAKIAIKFSPSGIKTFLNGSLFQESTTAYSGFIEDLVFNPFNGLIELKSLILFDTAKSDTELINLTTL